MNKLKQIGLSALAGSLAVATASNAVEYSLTGDAYVVFSTEDSTSSETASGKHFAADMDLYTNASTELDSFRLRLVLVYKKKVSFRFIKMKYLKTLVIKKKRSKEVQ